MKNGKSKPKVVLDTNVLVSALVFGGLPRQVTDLVAKKAIVLVTSEEAMTELRRIVRDKFPEYVQLTVQLEQLLRRYAKWMQLGNIDISVSTDPDDNKFIETALLSHCDFIISGDRHLLELKQYEVIKIVKPAAFLKLYEF